MAVLTSVASLTEPFDRVALQAREMNRQKPYDQVAHNDLA
jgi:hypothetical protein